MMLINKIKTEKWGAVFQCFNVYLRISFNLSTLSMQKNQFHDIDLYVNQSQLVYTFNYWLFITLIMKAHLGIHSFPNILT